MAYTKECLYKGMIDRCPIPTTNETELRYKSVTTDWVTAPRATQHCTYTNPDEYPFPFKGTVRTPTVALGRQRRETRLVAPFYDEFLVLGAVTQLVGDWATAPRTRNLHFHRRRVPLAEFRGVDVPMQRSGS